MPKISRSLSEKRTVKTTEGMFISIEHAASREVVLPDTLSEEALNKESFKILLSLKKECLIPFVMDGLMTEKEYFQILEKFESLAGVAEPAT